MRFSIENYSPRQAGFLNDNMELVKTRGIDTSNTSYYDNTQRVKKVLFDRPYSAAEVLPTLLDTWALAEQEGYTLPLAQVRVIMPLSQEENLREGMGFVQELLEDKNVATRIAGRIPFYRDGESYGIYYLQVENRNRPAFPSKRSHNEAVAYGIERRGINRRKELPQGFSLHAIEFVHGSAHNLLGTNNQEDMTMEDLAQQLVSLHKAVFPYPHDPAQQTVEGVREILQNNPVAFITDSHGQVISAVLLERDDRFTFGGISLVEPTYFTHPADQYRQHGFSSHLRTSVQELARNSNAIFQYGGSPIMIFNESIRDISFHLCIENGYFLAGDGTIITGDLGDAYTAIGRATPKTGFAPLGVTYYPDPRLGIQDQHWIE